MHARSPGRREAALFTVPLVLGLPAWNNFVVPRLADGRWSYVLANATATGAVLAAARATGLSWQELGLGRGRLSAGLRAGARGAVLVASSYAAALAIPRLRPLLTDARVAGLDDRQIAYQVLLRIPVGTVLWEEVAFRGVLHAALARALPAPTAVAVGAAVFGTWHVRPTITALSVNRLADRPVARCSFVASGCLGAAAAGVVFTGLRLHSGSLFAPAVVHLATNSLGTLAARAAHRLR